MTSRRRVSAELAGATFATTLLCALSLFAGNAPIDLSQIIDRAMAEAALDAKVKPVSARNVQGADGYYSKCNYYSEQPGKTLLLRLYQAAPGYDAGGALATLAKHTPALKEISGLGDKAVATGGTASALPERTMMLYVIKGTALITIGLSGLDNESEALERARNLAQKILLQL